jgi:hypothetical protein
MENQLPRHKIEGCITDKVVNDKKGPKGFFYLDNSKDKLVCWSQSVFDKFEINDIVEIAYTVQENEFNGKIYHNKVISSMNYKDRGEVQFNNKEKEVLEDIGYPKKNFTQTKVIIKSDNGVVKLGGLYYKIKNVELELLDNSQPEQ